MQKTASVRFIFATIFLDALGIGIIIPILPDLLRKFSTDPVQAAQLFGYFISSYALMQFLASPVLGSLSDRYGRRPVLLVSLLGAGLDYIVMAFAPQMWILFLGRIVSGLTGASMTVASAYIADISDDKNRSANFGMIGAGFGLGFIVGPALGGLLGAYDHTVPFLVAAALNLLNFAFGYFVLPESLPAGSRRKMDLRRLNPLKSLGHVFRSSPLLGLIWIYLLIFLAGQVHPANWTLYTETKFGWTPTQVGLSLSFVGLSIAAVQGGFSRILIPYFGEIRSVTVGVSLSCVGYLLFAIANEGWMMYAIMVPFAFAGICGPAMQSLITKGTPASEQGELQGTLVSLGSFAAILGPLVYSELFAKFTQPNSEIFFPGAAYVAASMIASLAALLWIFKGKKISR